jgi:hypothetical protein
MMVDGQAALAAAGSGAVPTADRARDVAERGMDDAGELMVLAEERAVRANDAAARALAEASSELNGLIPATTSASARAPDDSGIGSALADVGNAFASFGNAALHDPSAVGAMALGAGEVFLGAGGEIGGVALDATGIGAVVGVPAAVVSAGVIATGATTLGVGAMTVAQSASGPDHVEPLGGDGAGGTGGGESVRPPAQKPTVNDSQLDEVVDGLYRGARSESRVGDGTTADAVRNERATGDPTAGRFHTRKANNTVRYLRNWLRRNPNGLASDREIAQREYDNLLDALGRTQ